MDFFGAGHGWGRGGRGRKIAKMAILGLLKITVFWNEGYDVIIYVHDVTDKILSRDSNYIVDVVMWPKFGNSVISMREVIIISIL